MNKNKTIACAMMILASGAYAGTMGDTTLCRPSSVPYLQIEGSYTWNTLGNTEIFNVLVKPVKTNWGGRVSAGAVKSYTDNWSFGGELGGGFYGNIKTSFRTTANTHSIDGYDALVGAIYKFNQAGMFIDRIRLFGAMGLMVQNLRIKSSLNSNPSTNLFSGRLISYRSQTQALPELKVGGIYNIFNKLDAIFSYAYVFGSRYQSLVTVTGTQNPPSQQTNGVGYGENPALSTILLGLRYNFA